MMEKRFKVKNEELRHCEGAFPRPLREKSALTPTLSHGRADLRTDGAKRVRIARNLSRWHVSAKGETFRAWSKSKTGSNSMRTIVSSRIAGEGLLKNVTSLPSYLPTLLPSKKAAFTLAEVLITLGIIGVVAAITLPPLITNIQSQVKAKRVQNIKQKFSKATDKMLAMSGMNGYGSTENFVEELKHHLKIAKVCDNDHLAECWGYSQVGLKDGKVWNIADTKTAKNLKMTNSETEEWANTVGIVTADGTSMILSYNKKCDMSLNVNPQWTTDQSSSTNCIAAVFDYNGGTKPNKFIGDITSKDFAKSDVIAFNAGGLGQDCAIELNNKCFGTSVLQTQNDARRYGYSWCAGANAGTISSSDGDSSHGPEVPATGQAAVLGIKKCYYEDDYWNAAVAMCGGVDKLPDESDLKQLANIIYHTDQLVQYQITRDDDIVESILGFNPDRLNICLWSGEEKDNKLAYAQFFGASETYYRALIAPRYDFGRRSNAAYYRVICEK